jgi:hypothetical protein
MIENVLVTLDSIRKHLASDKSARVVVATRTRQTVFAPKHIDMIRVNGEALQMQAGRNWLTIATNGTGLLVNIGYARMR